MSAAMRTPIWLMGHLPLNTTCSNTKQSHKIGKETKIYILATYAATLMVNVIFRKTRSMKINKQQRRAEKVFYLHIYDYKNFIRRVKPGLHMIYPWCICDEIYNMWQWIPFSGIYVKGLPYSLRDAIKMFYSSSLLPLLPGNSVLLYVLYLTKRKSTSYSWTEPVKK